MSEISVIIPVYNRAVLIGETLRSLLNQTLPAKEVIVVDDGSTDGTGEAVEREFSVFREQLSAWHKPSSVFSVPSVVIPSLRVIRQQNAGPGAARNRGLAEATGEFIHFFDSDDVASPNKHEVQLRALLETGADIAYGPWIKGRFLPRCESRNGEGDMGLVSYDVTANTPGSADTCNPPPVSRYPGFHPEGPVLQAKGLPKGDLVKALLTHWSIVPHACLFRRSILEKAGAFPEDIWVGEDQLLFLKCLLAGAKVVHTPGTMVLYRLGDEGKLTESQDGQARRVTHWARFLVKANKEVTSGEWQVASASQSVHSKALDSAPSWFGVRLRAYRAWRDLRGFFPGEYQDLESGLEKIWKRNWFSVFGFPFSAFFLRIWAGAKFRFMGHRWLGCFRCEMASKASLEALRQ